MKALVYLAPNEKALQDRPQPVITAPTDAIVKVTKTTICGTDLHILKGATCLPARPGAFSAMRAWALWMQWAPASPRSRSEVGDAVLISCISAWRKCANCRRQMYSHGATGGWILGSSTDGTQAEYVRIPHADMSLYPIPAGADEEALVVLSDIFPTALECCVLNGRVQPGSTVAIVGGGPTGLGHTAHSLGHHDRPRRGPPGGGQALWCNGHH